MKWYEALIELEKKWDYVEIAPVCELWQCRSTTDEGLGSDNEFCYESSSPSGALKKACDAEGIKLDV